MSNRLNPDQDVLLGLIWVQTVCKGYQQGTKASTIKERAKESVPELQRYRILEYSRTWTFLVSWQILSGVPSECKTG